MSYCFYFRWQLQTAMDFEKGYQLLSGVQTYCRKAELFHLPSIRIIESSMPALAVVVLAQFGNCAQQIEIWDSSSLQCCSIAALTCCVTVTFVSKFPFLNLKNGPGSTPWTTIKFKTACTSHKGQSVLQFNKRIYSLSKLYRLVPFKCTWIRLWGNTGLSFATSPYARCFFWSKADHKRVGVPTLSAFNLIKRNT